MKVLRDGHPSFPARKVQASLVCLVLAEKIWFWGGRGEEQTERKGDSTGHSIHPANRHRLGAGVGNLLRYPLLFAWSELEGAKHLEHCPPLPMLDSKA